MLTLKEKLGTSTVDRRSEPRTFANGEVILRRQGAGLLPARLCDRSAMGMRITHSAPLTVGELVDIMTPELDLQAHVAWSLPSEAGFESGLRIKE